MSTVLAIACVVLLVIVTALVRQNSKLRNNNINLGEYQVIAAGQHVRVLADLDHRLHAAVTALMRELISHGETMAAHLTLEAEHDSLKRAHEFLWARATVLWQNQTREIEMLTNEPVTYWPSTTTASYPVESPPYRHLPVTEQELEEIENPMVSPFID